MVRGGRQPGRRTFPVVNLTVQDPGGTPDPKSPRSAAVANSVRGQLVDGQDYIPDSIFRKPGLKGTGSQLDPQRS